MNEIIKLSNVSLPEITEETFLAHFESEDFLRRYGNPVVVRGRDHHDLVCMAAEYYQRLVQTLDSYENGDMVEKPRDNGNLKEQRSHEL